MLAQVAHELLRDVHRNLVGTVVVIAERHIIALPLKVHRDAPLVADHLHPCVANRRQRVRHNGEPRDARGPDSLHVAIVQRHLECFIGIFVVHVVNHLQRIHIHLRQPAHRLFKLFHHLVVVQIFRSDRLISGSHLYTRLLVAPPVDCVEEALGQVGTCAKELHLLAYLHWRHAAGNAIVVAIVGPHQVVILILYGRGIHRHFCAEPLPVFRALLRPEHREVRLRCRPQVVERLQIAERSARDQRPSVQGLSPQRFRHPYRVAREKLVVVRCTEETHDAQLDDQLIYQLLGFRLGDQPFAQVLLDVDIEEGRCAPQRHGRAILVLHGSQVREIEELHRLAAVACRLRHVEPVGLAHLFKRLQRFNLLAHLLAAADGIFGKLLYVEPLHECFPLPNQRSSAIEWHTAVVTNNASTAIGIRQSRDDARPACRQHLVVVCREDAFVMRLAIACVDLFGHLVQRVAVCIQRILHHADAPFGEDAPFQRCVGLQSHHHLVLPVNISRAVGINLLREFRFGIIHPFGLFFAEHLREPVPHLVSTLRGCHQK